MGKSTSRKGKVVKAAINEWRNNGVQPASVGIDLGDRSDYTILDKGGKVLERGSKLPTTTEAMGTFLRSIPPTRIAIEVGTHSPWVARLIKQCGHEAVVANPRKLALISGNKRKNNRVDADMLAELARTSLKLLHPIEHRSEQEQLDTGVLRTRDLFVKARTQAINHVRNVCKSVGFRLPRCSAEAFSVRCPALLPEILISLLLPVVEHIGELTARIRAYDKMVTEVTKSYPITEKFRQINGVGPVTSLSFRLTIQGPDRFAKSRQVGAYLGLVPGSDDTGDKHVPKRITKEGDMMLRKLLTSGAQYILGPFGKDCDLQRFGLAIASRGGKIAKKRAVVAVARKLAVLMHRLWVTGEDYDPFRKANALEKKNAAA